MDAVGDFLLKVNYFLFALGEPKRRFCWELIVRGVYLDVQVGDFISRAHQTHTWCRPRPPSMAALAFPTLSTLHLIYFKSSASLTTAIY